MSRIKEIRQAVDTLLDEWEARAEALQTHLELGKEQAIDRVEQQKTKLAETLEILKRQLERPKAMAEEAREKLEAQIDRLEVQLALGRMETRDVYEDQRERIKDAIASMETTFASTGQHLDYSFDEIERRLIQGVNALDAEMEALRLQFGDKKDEFEAKREALEANIQAFRADLEAKRRMTKDKASTFEQELLVGLSKIRDAFANLFT